MFDALQSYLEKALEPIHERLQILSDENEELRRRLQLMVRLGLVSDISDDNRAIKVKHGELNTPFIRWFSLAAGKVKHFRLPSIGEQVILLNFASGDNSAQSLALVGFDSESFPIPADNPNQVVTQFGDNCSQIIDMEQGTMLFTASKSITFDTPERHLTGNEFVQGDADTKGNIKGHKDITDKHNSMDHMRDIFGPHNHGGSVPPPSSKMK